MQSFTGGPGQDVSCELKGILAQGSGMGSRVPWRQAIMYTLSYRQHPFSDQFVANATEYKG